MPHGVQPLGGVRNGDRAPPEILRGEVGHRQAEAGPAHAATIVDLFTRTRQAPRVDPFRSAAPPEPPEDRPHAPGRMGMLLALCQQARKTHRERTGEALRPGTLLQLLRYACRYAYLEGGLGPDLYQLVIAARCFADDNDAHEVW